MLHDLTGLGDDDQDEADLTPQQRLQRQKVKAEQDMIANLLRSAGSRLVNSDATLGSSKVEEDRAKDLIRVSLSSGVG